MSAVKEGVVVRGEPRVDLLPPEIKLHQQARGQRRMLVALVVLVALLCGGGYAFASVLAAESVALADKERAVTQNLLAQQAKYAEARTATARVTAIEHARLVGSASEILWADYMADLQATVPEGMVLVEVTVDSVSVLEPERVSALPLEGPHTTTLLIRATTPGIATIPVWIDALAELPGFVDSWISPVTLADGVYEVDVRLNIDSSAHARRFFEESAAETPIAADAANAVEEKE